MTGQCTPCHAVSVGQRIDQETEELSVGATLKARDLTLSYFHTERDFTTGTDRYAHQGMVDNDYWYDEAFKSESGAGPLYNTTFESRELFEGEHAPIGSTPESEKTTDTVKLRYDAPLQTTLYGSYVSSSAQNNDTDLDYDMDTAYFSINNRAIRGLNLKAYIKNYRLDNDDYTTTLEDSGQFHGSDDARHDGCHDGGSHPAGRHVHGDVRGHDAARGRTSRQRRQRPGHPVHE